MIMLSMSIGTKNPPSSPAGSPPDSVSAAMRGAYFSPNALLGVTPARIAAANDFAYSFVLRIASTERSMALSSSSAFIASARDTMSVSLSSKRPRSAFIFSIASI